MSSLSTFHDNQTGFLDYVDIAAAGGPPTPTPTPGPTGPPVDGVAVGTVVAVLGTTSITGTEATGQLAVSTAIARLFLGAPFVWPGFRPLHRWAE